MLCENSFTNQYKLSLSFATKVVGSSWDPDQTNPMKLFDLALIVCLEVKVDCCFVCDLTSQSC